MNWGELITGGAIGSALGFLGKEVFDVIKINRSHSLELKKRYFDLKINTSLEAIKEWKVVTQKSMQFFEVLRLATKREDIPPSVVQEFYTNYQRSIERLNQETKNVTTVLQFFYDSSRLKQLDDIGATAKKLLISYAQAVDVSEMATFIQGTDAFKSLSKEKQEEIIDKRFSEFSQKCDSVYDYFEKIDGFLDGLIESIKEDFRKYKV